MEDRISAAKAGRRFQTMLLSSFAGVALFLALVGLYALIAYAVKQRTAEIGIRMALGADRGSVLRLVMSQGMKLTVVGLALGLAASLAATRILSSLLFEIRPGDPTTFVGVALLLTLVALFACYVPARRATKIDPMVALRYE